MYSRRRSISSAAAAQIVGRKVGANAPTQHTVQLDRGNAGRCEAQFEARRGLCQVADLQQSALERDLANPQAALLIMCIEQGAWLVHGQAPWAQHRAVFVNFRGAQLQVQGMELVFHQLQRKADLLVVELRLQGHLLVGHQAGEQGLNPAVAIDQQAGHRVSQIKLGRVLHVLYEIQLVLGQERICLHDRTRRWRFLQRD